MFVCHGNICRSPMAEFIFKDMIKKKGLDSDFTYTYKKNVKFTQGTQLDYYVNINSNGTGADTTVFCPIFEIKTENTTQTKYFVPISQTYGGDNNLSYRQIKEYVQK